jgi:hypothetical protein
MYRLPEKPDDLFEVGFIHDRYIYDDLAFSIDGIKSNLIHHIFYP